MERIEIGGGETAGERPPQGPVIMLGTGWIVDYSEPAPMDMNKELRCALCGSSKVRAFIGQPQESIGVCICEDCAREYIWERWPHLDIQQSEDGSPIACLATYRRPMPPRGRGPASKWNIDLRLAQGE